MKRVLIVDDDPIVLRIYRDGLASRGFVVETAADGVTALKAMNTVRPDVVVLDLMMPRLSGQDVLKLMRGQPALIGIPVIVLSNSYMDAPAVGAPVEGATTGLLKVRCSPSILTKTILQVLSGGVATADQVRLPAVEKDQRVTQPGLVAGPARGESATARPQRPPVAEPAPLSPVEDAARDAEVRTSTRAQFLGNAAATCSALRGAFEAFEKAAPGNERSLRLRDLYRRVHFLVASAGLAECHHLAQIGTAFEALLFRMMDDPARITPSSVRTVNLAIDSVQTLFREAQAGNLGTTVGGQVLVVDDDPVSNRLVVWALTQAGLRARSTEDPAQGLELLKAKKYDLILLDIEMPTMSGFDLCRRAREFPGYAKTPIIYVTVHSDFEHCAQSILAGGDDLIGKPVLPMELAVKATMHLLKQQTQGQAKWS